jgi:hypothetical protein
MGTLKDEKNLLVVPKFLGPCRKNRQKYDHLALMLLGSVRETFGVGTPMYCNLGESLTLGLGRGDGIGILLPELGEILTLGERLTCSSALVWRSSG